MELKKTAALSAVECVQNGQVLGLGSGTTSSWALRLLAERIRDEKLEILGVPTSLATEREAHDLGIPLTTLERHPALDLALDGADQVDERLCVIKGRGGALLREKIVARSARRFLVMVDETKIADVLDIAVPTEVLPFGLAVATRGLEALGGRVVLRRNKNEPYVSDNGNWIVDVDFGPIRDPAALARQIADVPGVLDHGLFVDLVAEVHVGEPQRARVLRQEQ